MDTITGIFLIAVGAILKFAVHASVRGIEIGTIGVILMVAGAAIVVISLLYDARWAGRRRGERVVVRDDRV
jgi:hypothetical protein